MAVGRPLALPLYLERPRLLERLPEAPGEVLLLEAPFGYGKSVLLAQWTERLKGLRTIWLALLPDDDPKRALEESLGLPHGSPWRAILADLKERPTVLVLDDLQDPDAVAPLLRDPPALLGIASRRRLASPEIAVLAAQGRLVRLSARDLAFTLEEATRLLGDAERAETLWEKTGGWPIALHLAAVSGGEPDWASLAEGLRKSLGPELFGELLLFAGVRELPREAATEATERLAEAGLLQAAEGGFRLHAALAEALPQREVRAAVLKNRERIPPHLYGLALERLGLFEELAALLEAPSGPALAATLPEAVLRWHQRAPGPAGPHRRMRVAIALLNTGRTKEAIQAFLELARSEGAPAFRLEAYGLAAYALAEAGRVAEAAELLNEAEPLEAEVRDLEFLARYLNNRAAIAHRAGDRVAARALFERATQAMPKTSPFAPILAVNRALFRFEEKGDLIGLKEALANLFRAHEAGEVPTHFIDVILWVEYGRALEWTGAFDKAQAAYRQAAELRHLNRIEALIGEAELFRLEKNPEALARALSGLELLEKPEAADRARGYLIALLLEAGQSLEARRQLPEQKGFFTQLAEALLEGKPELLPKAQSREEKLHRSAAGYRLTGEMAYLEELVRLTNAGERVLPAFVPLKALPKERPEWALAYPLKELLTSGWSEAIRLRHREIPPLKIQVLGAFKVKGPLGEIHLSRRLKEILALMLLGLDREALLAAIWPDADPERARNNLYVQLNHLRKLLEPWGVPTYLGEQGLMRTESDWALLQEALAEQNLERALALYREPAFPGVDNPRVDEAVAEARTRLIHLGLEEAERRAPNERLALLKALFALDPGDPELFARYAEALKTVGQEAALQAAYRRFAETFSRTVGEAAPPLGELLRPH